MRVDWLLGVRPAFVALLLKRALQVQRAPYKTPDGLTFFLDPVTHFGGEVLRAGCYERALTQVIAGLLRHGDTFLDIGANEGYFSVLGARCVGRDGRVLAVEPQSRLIPIVRR